MKELIMKSKMEKFYLGTTKGIISSKVGSHSNDPYVIKKAEKATETLKRVGFPAEILKIQAVRMKK